VQGSSFSEQACYLGREPSVDRDMKSPKLYNGIERKGEDLGQPAARLTFMHLRAMVSRSTSVVGTI